MGFFSSIGDWFSDVGSDVSDWLGSSSGTNAGSLLNAGVGSIFDLVGSYFANSLTMRNAKEMADYNKEISKELADYGFELQERGLNVAKDIRNQSVQDTPGLLRAGLLAAGYNPILAVNSSAGAPFAQSMSPSVGSASSAAPSFPLSRTNFLSLIREASAIRQTDAETEFIKRKTLGEGWQIRTLSRSEAKGLGANLIGKLGFNFHDTTQTTFLVAYNPITGELRNLGDTDKGIGHVEPTSADDVPEGEVIVSEPYHVRATQAFPKGRKHN